MQRPLFEVGITAWLILLPISASPAHAFAAAEGPAYLVRDINTAPDPAEHSGMRAIVRTDRFTFFTADDGVHGRELWRTDGTPQGTVLVLDLAAGPEDGLVSWPTLLPFGEFVAFWSDVDRALWVSDGTEERTIPLFEGAYTFTTLGAGLFIIAWNEAEGFVLWHSDGSPHGTRRAGRIQTPCSRLSLHGAGKRLFVSGSSYSRTLQTCLGVVDVGELGDYVDGDPEPIDAERFGHTFEVLAPLGNVFLIAASTSELGNTVWRSDGTQSGTFPLTDGPHSPAVLFQYGEDEESFVEVNGDRAFFIATDEAHGPELWTTDGTPAGTRLVKDIIPGPEGLFPCPEDHDPICEEQLGIAHIRMNIIALEDRVLVARRLDSHLTVWSSDGSADGTYEVDGIVPGAMLMSDPLLMDGASMLFSSYENGEGRMWIGDATIRGSRPFPRGGSYTRRPDNGFVISLGEPWWTDGTESGTYLLADVRRGNRGSYPRGLTDLNGTLIFAATDAERGRELWRSDGTADGTFAVRDIQAGAGGSRPVEITRAGDAIFFAADDGAHGVELWHSDGTESGTVMARDIRPGSEGSAPTRLVAVGDLIYFFADDGAHGIELWRSDGSPEGTVLVADVAADGGGGDYYFSATLREYIAGTDDGRVFFVADDGINGIELWRSDGPDSAPHLLVDLNPGPESGYPRHLLASGNTLFFVAEPKADRRRLHRSDGTLAGTVEIEAPDVTFIEPVYDVGNQLLFPGRKTHGPVQMWSLHGDEIEPELVGEVNLRYRDGWRNPAVAGGSVFVLAEDNRQIWRSDGPPLAPHARDLAGRHNSPDLYGLIAAQGKILFAGSGREWQWNEQLWTTDGTPEGTWQLQTFPEANHSSGFRSEERYAETVFAAAGDLIFFAGDFGDTGNELWALPLDVLPLVRDPPTPLPTATPTSTMPSGSTQSPTPTATSAPTDTASPSPPPCPLSDDPPGCTRVEVHEASTTAGQTAVLKAGLRSLGEPVVAVQVDLTFDPQLRIATTASGSPDCSVEATIGKRASVFSFVERVCAENASSCPTVRALIFAFDNFDAIADGATLFSCRVEVDAGTPPGTYPILLSNAAASDRFGQPIPSGTTDATIVVNAEHRSALTAANDSVATGCTLGNGQTTSSWPLAAGLLTALALANAPRKRRVNLRSRRLRRLLEGQSRR